MARAYGELIVVHKGWPEERKAVDVIPMGMGQQQVRTLHPRLEESVSKGPDPCAGIHDETVIARFDFDATRIAAILHMLRRGAGDTPSYSPKFKTDGHTLMQTFAIDTFG